MKMLTMKTNSLEMAVEETGPEDGEPILLLHGFPYDPRCFDGVIDKIRDGTRRILVPYLRGFGPTRYRSEHSFRSGQQAALGNDVLELLNEAGIVRATLMGYDWGGRAATVVAALWPERVRGLVCAGGYAIQDIKKSSKTPGDVELEYQQWYQWYFNMDRGRVGLEMNRKALSEKLWRLWSPNWFDAGLFEREALSFENPDFVATAIHSYRHRYGNAAGDPALEPLEARLAEQPKITVPTIGFQGEDDRVSPPAGSEGKEGMFTAYYERRLLSGVGHCAPQEAPGKVAQMIEDALRLTV
ncbi:Epoxide hydrolase [Acidisarcina polymorpha]|uniref:Epoxide hydrolase n=1 Tax=Acidisarcina polymorpha TaxID=2211140 RepID=A0A2Z5G4A1_9BACT|nr:alpha/beta hydrolase [Acidisarcina polymorpha]AXC13557.1 Epoxide hydrolase [Acidisarcina polymorpha]